MTGTLYLVATPIGNLQDMTFRAVETLKSVDLIACEDTRHTQKLLNHFGFKNKLVSYHEHNEIERADELAEILKTGKNIAVVSDAGTPAICDPSFRVVAKAIEIGAKVVPIPGAVAFVSALIVSGLPTDAVFFGGFLPARKNERIRRLEELKSIPATLVFYETPHRIERALVDCLEVLGNRNASLSREVTKLHEETIRGTLREISAQLAKGPVKGELVLTIERTLFEEVAALESGANAMQKRLAELEGEGLERRAALKKVAKEFGLTRSEAYRRLAVSSGQWSVASEQRSALLATDD